MTIQLKSFQVTNFQSVLDSRRAQVGNVTCLVGKNEAGKTALLKALYRLNPIRPEDGKYDYIDDYPRVAVSDYEEAVKRGARKPATVVRATFELDAATLGLVEEKLGPGFLTSSRFDWTKSYANERECSISCDENKAITFLSRNLSGELQQRAVQAGTPRQLLEVVEPSAQDPAVAAIIPLLKQTGNNSFSWYAFNNIIAPYMPKLLYFDEYYQMRGAENIEQLKQRQATNTLRPSDHPILGLVELAGLDLETLLNPQRTQELKNRLEGAGNRLTSRILKYWSQNKHLQMRFDVRPARPGDPEDMRGGTNIWGEVYDTRHYVSTAISSRSRGFVWFFSFVAWYSQVKRRGDNVILLLDEPGLTLHGRAQGDLLRYFEEELAPNHQVIYTTHSPFMVDPRHFERVRIVQDKSIDQEDLPEDQQGTKVVTDIFEASDDSLFPLQGALDYEIHQTLFIGPNNLMIEGASDMLYIPAISAALERRGREGLSSKWTLVPTGGAGRVPTFVRLLVGQKGMKLATLIDVQAKDRQTIDNLYREKLLKKSNVLTFADFTGTKEADVEDMFDVPFYLRLVNEEFRQQLNQPIAEKDLTARAPRVLQRLEEYLAAHPFKVGAFSHFRPARYFTENLAALEPAISSATLDRFEAAFNALNKLL